MSGEPRRVREARGRILLVGGHTDPIGAALRALGRDWRRAEWVPDRFDALAAIGSATASSPVVALVAAPDSIDGDAERFAGCVREVDPAVEMFICGPPGAPPSGHSMLSVPADPVAIRAALLRALDPVAEAPMHDPPGGGGGIESTSPALEERRRHETETLPPETALTGLAAPEPAAPPPLDPPEIEAIATPEPPVEMPPSSAPVGDIDLAAAVLLPGRLAEVALRAIRERLEDPTASFLPPEPMPDAPDRIVVEVRDAEERLGWLASRHAPATALAAWAAWLAVWLRLDRRHRELERQAATDDLTGVGNRRGFETVLAETLAAARPKRRPVTLMVFDIDNFKTYNDQFGHEAGDEVLREVVQVLRSTIRRGDHVFRIGGDEFVVIFSDPGGPRSAGTTPPESVEQVVRRFQAQVFRMKLPQLGLDAPGTVTISAGLATYPWDGLDAQSLLRHADRLALQSKRSGKNQLTFGPGASRRQDG
jgi:diguanylate cyclase (GGDEF)-like protein